jgi:uncharacterized protein YnzC (UPF0291/DUF896 family)
VDAEGGDLTRQAAETLLELDFRPADRKRMNKLAEKASAGKLTARESEEAESFNRVAHVLALLQSKARRSLARNRKIHSCRMSINDPEYLQTCVALIEEGKSPPV